ncbi:AraC family transcriptional regulator [Dactylosporangium sp. NPDC051541]|uniref:AraC family transcriptional regulator n=1 Tax=Dactylosporangium sp. NPDC051541 TaxID=3363977 RepID=UPI00379AB7B4
MDVLSDAVTALRTGRPVASALSWTPPFGQRFAAVPGAVGIQVVVRGAAWLLPDSGAPGVRLGAGDVLLLSDGHGHALADSPTTPLQPCTPAAERAGLDVSQPTLVVCGAYELGDLRTHPLLHQVPALVHLSATPSVQRVVELLLEELRHGAQPDGIGVTALLDLLFLHTLRAWFEKAEQPGALGDPTVRAALEAIHRSPEAPWTVATLAREGGVSRSALARRFTTLTGVPPQAYLTWWRLTLAAKLLRESDAPLRVVARRVGYASEFAFAAAFKRHTGTAPGRFRTTSTTLNPVERRLHKLAPPVTAAGRAPASARSGIAAPNRPSEPPSPAAHPESPS